MCVCVRPPANWQKILACCECVCVNVFVGECVSVGVFVCVQLPCQQGKKDICCECVCVSVLPATK